MASYQGLIREILDHLEQELVLVGVGQAVPLEDDEVGLFDGVRVVAELAPDKLEQDGNRKHQTSPSLI